MTNKQENTYLTVAEVAARLNVCRTTIRRYYQANKLGIVRLSARTIRISEAALEQFIRRNQG